MIKFLFKKIKILIKATLILISFFLISSIYYISDYNRFSLIDYYKSDLLKIITKNDKSNILIGEINESFDYKNKKYNIKISDFRIEDDYLKNINISIDLKNIKNINVFSEKLKLSFLKKESGVYIENKIIKSYIDNSGSFSGNNFDIGLNFEISDLELITKKDDKIYNKLNYVLHGNYKNKNISLSVDSEDLNADLLINKSINVFINGDYTKFNDLLNNTPLYHYKRYVPDILDYNGNLSLDLLIPEKIDNYNININFKNGELYLKDLNLNFEKVNGYLNISDKENIVEGKFSSLFFKNTIKTNLYYNHKNELGISAYGYTNINFLNSWLKNRFLNDFDGGSIFQTDILISKDVNKITVKSKLDGIDVNMPYPFYKVKSKKNDFIFNHDFYKNNTFVHFDNHNIKIENDKKILVGLNQLTPKNNYNSGVFISGDIDKFNLDEILNYIYKNNNYNIDDNKTNLKEVKINSEKILFKDHLFNDCSFDLSFDDKNKEYFAKLKSKEIELSSLYNTQNKNYITDIEKLHIDLSESDIKTSKNDINLALFDNGKVRIQDFKINNEKISNLMIDIPKSINKNITEFYITSDYKSTNLNAKMIYDRVENKTTIYSSRDNFKILEGDNIFDITSRTNPNSPTTSEKFYLDINISWEGKPNEFKISKMKGLIEINVKNLKMKGLKEEYTKMKIFNIFNLESLFKMMSLNFDSISNKEIFFDNINIKYEISNGLMSTKNFKLDGDDLSLEVEGDINILDNSIDSYLSVTLPITDKISGISLLFGATPQTAGIIYILDKVVGHKINDLFKAEYKIYGDFLDLKIEKD